MLRSEKLQQVRKAIDGLAVHISSFSFHRECRAMTAETAAGLLFDGRSLPNPGREERFRELTGKDAHGDRVSESAGKRSSNSWLSVYSLRWTPA